MPQHAGAGSSVTENGNVFIVALRAEKPPAVMPVALLFQKGVDFPADHIVIKKCPIRPKPGMLPPVIPGIIKILLCNHPVRQRPGMPAFRDFLTAPGDFMHVWQGRHRQPQKPCGKVRCFPRPAAGRRVDFRDALRSQPFCSRGRLLSAGFRQAVLLIVRFTVPDKQNSHGFFLPGF